MATKKQIVKIIGKDGNEVPRDYVPFNMAFYTGTDITQCGFTQDMDLPIGRSTPLEGKILRALVHIWVNYKVTGDIEFFQKVGRWVAEGLPYCFSHLKDKTIPSSAEYAVRMGTVVCCMFDADDIIEVIRKDLLIGDPTKNLQTHPDDFQYHLAFAGCLLGLQAGDYNLAQQQFEILERYPVNKMRYVLLESVLVALIAKDEKAFNKQLDKSIARFWKFANTVGALTPTEEKDCYIYDIYTAERENMTVMWPYLELAVARIAVRLGFTVTACDDFFLPAELIHAK